MKVCCRNGFVYRVLIYYLNLTINIHEYFLLYLRYSIGGRLMVCCYLSYHFLQSIHFEFIFSIGLLLLCSFSNLSCFFYLHCLFLLNETFGNSLKLLVFLIVTIIIAFLLISKLQIIICEVFEILIFLFKI